MTRLNLEWKNVGSHAVGSCPPLVRYECEVGVDENGDTWLCHVEYREYERIFELRYDVNVETDDGMPFLRGQVLDADDYWAAVKEYYEMETCEYEEIQDRIRAFIKRHNLEAYDVAYKRV